HSTAAGALNTAAWLAYSGIDLPLLLVCEDNGWGISTPTPDGWVANTLQGYSPIEYATADSAQPRSLLETCDALAERVRKSRRPSAWAGMRDRRPKSHIVHIAAARPI